MKTFFVPIKIHDVKKFINGTEDPIKTALKYNQAMELGQTNRGVTFAVDFGYAQDCLRRTISSPPPLMGRARCDIELTQPPAGVILEIQMQDENELALSKMFKNRNDADEYSDNDDVLKYINDDSDPKNQHDERATTYSGSFNPATVVEIHSFIERDPSEMFPRAYYPADKGCQQLRDEITRRMEILERLQGSIDRAWQGERERIHVNDFSIRDAFAPNGYLHTPDDMLSFGDRMCRDTLNTLVGADAPDLVIAADVFEMHQWFAVNMGVDNASPETYQDVMGARNAFRIIKALGDMLTKENEYIPERFKGRLNDLQAILPSYVTTKAAEDLGIDVSAMKHIVNKDELDDYFEYNDTIAEQFENALIDEGKYDDVTFSEEDDVSEDDFSEIDEWDSELFDAGELEYIGE